MTRRLPAEAPNGERPAAAASPVSHFFVSERRLTALRLRDSSFILGPVVGLPAAQQRIYVETAIGGRIALVEAMTRREFLTSMGLVAGSRTVRAGPRMEISVTRLREQLESLSAYGRPAGGKFLDRVSRTGYSDADHAGR